MAKDKQKQKQTQKQQEQGMNSRGINSIDEEILCTILSKLPALSFASAACVSRTWNAVCGRILSRPKISSALSLNPSLQGAANEVLDKVLLEPIRPHFAIAYIANDFPLQQAHKLLTERLGLEIPVITVVSNGVIGRDALTDEFKEVQWYMEYNETDDQGDTSANAVADVGISLTVGFLPGLKVNLIPLLEPMEELQVPLIDKFVMDIRNSADSVSGCSTPAGIVLFGDSDTDMRHLVEKMDYFISRETIIVGGGCSQFLCSGGTHTRRFSGSTAVAFLFVRDRNKPPGTGEIQFYSVISTGLLPVGPIYKAASVKAKHWENSTWLTARREGFHENLDGDAIINHIQEEIGDQSQAPPLYIGVTKRRKCSIGSRKAGLVTFRTFHELLGGDEEYLYVHGMGIRTGDFFRFYMPNPDAAASSCANVSENLSCLRETSNHNYCSSVGGAPGSCNTREVFGGIMFACCGRGETFFGRPHVDSTPFLKNFPGVSLSGTFCLGEIGRGDMSSYIGESDEHSFIRCFLHAFSTVYLVMSYTPALPQN